MTLIVKIKEKSYLNKHNDSKINVLKNVNFSVKNNEFICIVGPSGCGKTTLMNMIGGIVNLDKNQVELVQQNESNKEDNFGYVFQTSRLLPWLTVIENVELVCEDKKVDKKKIVNLLESFGLKDFINFYPNSISGGMRRKVALARALINDPSILLMDEPFVSLDQPTSENLYEVLINYKKKNPITVVFITHVLKEALLLGDRILFFSKNPGTIVFDYKVKSKKKPLSIDNISVDKEYKVLKTKHPQLLQGLI